MKTSKKSAKPASNSKIHMSRVLAKLKTHCSRLLLVLLLLPILSSAWGQVVGLAALLANPTTTFDQLPGWGQDDLQAFLPALLQSCQALRNDADLTGLCQNFQDVAATDTKRLRSLIEKHFVAQMIRLPERDSGLLTGYYEPLLHGSRTRDARYRFALYRKPPAALVNSSRADITNDNVLTGYELLWVDDEMDAFFLQVQGSGRVMLPSGQIVRVGYDGNNGAAYRAVGAVLLEQGEMEREQISMQSIRAWTLLNPEKVTDLLLSNPRYVYFRELPLVKANDADKPAGPPGALGVPLTPGRSIAAEMSQIPAGWPVWLAPDTPLLLPRPNSGRAAVQAGQNREVGRLVLVQDKGAAIEGVLRYDLFMGFGAEAERIAGVLKAPVQAWLLVPRTVFMLQGKKN